MLGRLSREKFDVAFIDLVHDAAPHSDPRSLPPSLYRPLTASQQRRSPDLITTGRRRAPFGPRRRPPRPPGAGRGGDRHQESRDRDRMAQGGTAEDFGDRSRRARPPRPHAEPDVTPGRDVAARAQAANPQPGRAPHHMRPSPRCAVALSRAPSPPPSIQCHLPLPASTRADHSISPILAPRPSAHVGRRPRCPRIGGSTWRPSPWRCAGRPWRGSR